MDPVTQIVLGAAIGTVTIGRKVGARKGAIIGGVIAGTLWEAVRSILMWYFANLSLVHVIYGSLATVVVVLVSLEIAAMILLLVAEVLAELERRHVAGNAWYEPTT